MLRFPFLFFLPFPSSPPLLPSPDTEQIKQQHPQKKKKRTKDEEREWLFVYLNVDKKKLKRWTDYTYTDL